MHRDNVVLSNLARKSAVNLCSKRFTNRTPRPELHTRDDAIAAVIKCSGVPTVQLGCSSSTHPAWAADAPSDEPEWSRSSKLYGLGLPSCMGVQRCQQPGGHSDRARLPSGRTNTARPGRRAARVAKVTLVKGEPLPPTTAANRTYQLVDPTKTEEVGSGQLLQPESSYEPVGNRGAWKQMKAASLSHWHKLSEEDVVLINGKRDVLALPKRRRRCSLDARREAEDAICALPGGCPAARGGRRSTPGGTGRTMNPDGTKWPATAGDDWQPARCTVAIAVLIIDLP